METENTDVVSRSIRITYLLLLAACTISVMMRLIISGCQLP